MGRHKKRNTNEIENKKRLKVITVNIYEEHHKLLKELVKLGRFGSVSEGFRNMADDWLTWKIDSGKEITRMVEMLEQINNARESIKSLVLEDNRSFVQHTSKKFSPRDVIDPVDKPMTVINMEHPEREVLLKEEIITEDGKTIRLREYGYEVDRESYIAKNTDENGMIRVPKELLPETASRMFINTKE